VLTAGTGTTSVISADGGGYPATTLLVVATGGTLTAAVDGVSTVNAGDMLVGGGTYWNRVQGGLQAQSALSLLLSNALSFLDLGTVEMGQTRLLIHADPTKKNAFQIDDGTNPLFQIDPTTGTVTFNAGYALSVGAITINGAFTIAGGGSFAITNMAFTNQLAGPDGDTEQSGRGLIAALPGSYHGWAVGGPGGLGFALDTINNVPKVYPAPAGALSPTVGPMPKAALVYRGSRLCVQNVPPAVIFDSPADMAAVVLQGGNLLPIADRTHQEIVSCCYVGTRLWATWAATNLTRGAASGEVAGEYIVLAYSDNNGATWVEAIHITTAVPATDRFFDSSFLYRNGNLWVFFSCDRSGIQSSDYSAGVWAARIENPQAPTIMNFVVSGPWRIAYGDMQTKPKLIGGIPYANTDYSRYDNGSPTVPAVAGMWFSRLWLDDFYPTAERVFCPPYASTTLVPSTVFSGECNFILRKDGTLLCIFRTAGGLGDFYTTSDITWQIWTAPAQWTATPNSVVSSRAALERSPTGRMVRVYNASAAGSRTNLTVTLSEDEGNTWPYAYTFDTRSDISYPVVIFDESGNILVSYDYGRGDGAGSPADLFLAVIPEAALVAGSPTCTILTISNLFGN
jgi:hypothetical protein